MMDYPLDGLTGSLPHELRARLIDDAGSIVARLIPANDGISVEAGYVPPGSPVAVRLPIVLPAPPPPEKKQ